ncbi:MAG: hypothetical protein HYY06_17775 [Deltaproteobacteria bacterium]|nr:hypothetical protein [Deltaproteobacteria bacterium]
MSHPTIETLMLLADGEKIGRSGTQVHLHLESCAACGQLLAEIERERALARDAIEASMATVSFEGFAARVMRSIEAERPTPVRERLAVWLREFLQHRRRVWMPAAAMATAAVLAFGFLALQAPPPPPEPGGSSVVSIRAASSAIVFDIPSQDGLSSTAVVWINDDAPEEGGSGS